MGRPFLQNDPNTWSVNEDNTSIIEGTEEMNSSVRKLKSMTLCIILCTNR